MPLTFVIPGPLREFASNRTEVSVRGPAVSVSEALALLWSEHPGLRDRVVTERGELRPHVNVFVNGCLIAQGEVVVVNDKFGIRLTDIITPSERIRKLKR